MNVNRLIKQLELDEGIRLRVYEDSLGYLTVGIGHYITKNDSEDIKDLKLGDKITKDKAYLLLMDDLVEAIQDAVIIFYDKWETFPHTAQEVFINMIFNMGRTHFMKFRKTIAAAYAHDWEEVSKEMLDSRWAAQVGSRAGRLSSKIRALAK